MRPTSACLVFLALTLLALPAAAADPPAAGELTSLREGNRLYREGRLADAYEAYLRAQQAGTVHPVLAYNLATTAHQLGRLPEAILWYRRSEQVNPGDPWLRENLGLARATLGLQPYPAPGAAALLARHAQPLFYGAALLAWGGLVLWIVRPRRSRRATIVLVAVAGLLYGATHLASRLAPRPAVILEPCSGAEGDLPAGAEVWITSESEAVLGVTAGSARLDCPRAAVGRVAG